MRSREEKFARISKIVTDVKEAGGVDSTAFWKVRNRILGRQEELGDVIEDDEPSIQDITIRYVTVLHASFLVQKN